MTQKTVENDCLINNIRCIIIKKAPDYCLKTKIVVNNEFFVINKFFIEGPFPYVYFMS